jgi:hypothetical protein
MRGLFELHQLKRLQSQRALVPAFLRLRRLVWIRGPIRVERLRVVIRLIRVVRLGGSVRLGRLLWLRRVWLGGLWIRRLVGL